IRLAIRHGAGPEAFLDRLQDAPAAVRAALYAAVRANRRHDLADALIGPVADRWGDPEAASLLPACTPSVVAGRLDALAHAVRNWATLGRRHPDAVLAYAERALAELPDSAHHAWWARTAPGIAAALRHDPGRVVRLLERHHRDRPLPRELHRAVGLLLDAEPERMLALLLTDAHRGDLQFLLWLRSFRNRIARLGDDDAAAVAQAVRENADGLRLLLKAFPPNRREAVFGWAMRGVDLTAVEIKDDLMEVLPRAVRHREARRMMGLRTVGDVPSRKWATAAFLPYEEALPILGELTRRTDAEERATGYAHLVRCAGRSGDPDTLRTALESLDRLRNEQDPVRCAALEALASVPEGLLDARHTAVIEQLADDALNARDLSYSTRHALARIAAALCRRSATRNDPDLLVTGLELFERLVGDIGWLPFVRLDRVLRRGREHELVATLEPRLRAAARRDDHRLALLLARALQRRAHGVPALQDALEAALDARDDDVIEEAIELWLAAPGTRAERVEKVVARDPSAVAVREVLAVIARERTDLLHLVLAETTPEGRFQRPDVTYVPRIEPAWTDRWTARQRESYRALLERLAASDDTFAGDRSWAISTLARIPGTEAARLRPYLQSDDAFVRRIALTALPWTSSPQESLPALLAHAESDDAHVAVYAAARAARFVPPSALAAMLRPVLTGGKITARKEAVRILLGNRVPGALDIIAEAWDDPGQHRDVRSAIASAVRARLDEPATWEILAKAVQGPRDLARQVLGTPPLLIEERFRERYAALMVSVARSDDPEARAAALPCLPEWAAWAPDIPALLADLVTDLDETSSWRDALHALVQCVVNGIGAAELGEAAARLAAAPPVPDAEPDRDLPAFQRLTALAERVQYTAALYGRLGRRTVTAVEGRLPEPFATELAAATLDWQDPGAADALDAIADRCARLGVLAVTEIADALAHGPSAHGVTTMPDPEKLHPHAVRLAARNDLAGGLLACSLTEKQGGRVDWPAEWRELLRTLRGHPHPEVAFRARRIHTSAE
ncbi:MAG TPA: hypothetical protein VIL71_04190, partial [Spirillospora sp.]